jgi:hypothetical protein
MLEIEEIFKEMVVVNTAYKYLKINFKVWFMAKIKKIVKCQVLKVWFEAKN